VRVALLLGLAAVTMGGCERPLTGDAGHGGNGGNSGNSGNGGNGGTTGGAGTTGRGGEPGTAGTTGSAGNGFGTPVCAATVTVAAPCTDADPQLCYRVCGPDNVGARQVTCEGGIYVLTAACTFDPSRDYSCYSIPPTPSPGCQAGITPQANTPCFQPSCELCNSLGGLQGGIYLDSAGAAKTGFCTCAANMKWSCATDTAWPCPAGRGCSGSGTGGIGGAAGAGGLAGTGGMGGIAGTGGSGGIVGPSCTGLITAAGMEPTKGVACVAADPQLCYKTCGPEKTGVKSETCSGGVYFEMSGCSFDPGKDYSCYQIPSTANATCPAVPPQASQACTVDHCVACNSQSGLPGGLYLDAAGATKVGYCVCQLPNAAGMRTWSCANDTAWPCPAGVGCNGTAGAGTGGAAGAGGAGGSSGSFGEPACLSTVAKGVACLPTDQQFCYKTCGPEKTGIKSETCAGGVYAEMSGCAFDPAKDYSCYKIPTTANAACGTPVAPVAGGACDVPQCSICNSTSGLPGGHFFDSAGAEKVGYCTCQPPNSSGIRTWSCATDTQWPCPIGVGC